MNICYLTDQNAAYDHDINAFKQSVALFLSINLVERQCMLNVTLAKLLLNRMLIAVSSSEIAASLLQGGFTVHSTFKQPRNPNSDVSPVCNTPKTPGLARLLNSQCYLIVSCECITTHKGSDEAVHRTAPKLNSQLASSKALPKNSPADEPTESVEIRKTFATDFCRRLFKSYYTAKR